MTELVTTPPKELPSPEVMSRVLLGGDLAQLTPAQLVSYYGAVCDSVGLNPLTKPFEFLKLSGKLVLYATRNCTDQLRKIYGISVALPEPGVYLAPGTTIGGVVGRQVRPAWLSFLATF